MKLFDSQNNAVISHNMGVGEFTIKQSRKSFQLLSSGLYSNKIRAIIRELYCNALDSHVAAGCPDVPVEIHLPTQLEPWFSVKDYGTGLDDIDIAGKLEHVVVFDSNGNPVLDTDGKPTKKTVQRGGIYNTYFESTKTQSNSFIGALGLGSKSPFSYTDNFTVTAVKDGTIRIYAAFINDTGVPSVSLMFQGPTEEANGVEVKFSVTDASDFRKFAAEATEVLSWTKTLPTLTGEQISIELFRTSCPEAAPGIYNRLSGYSRPSVALMGNIAYPISDAPNTVENFGDLVFYLNIGLIFEFDIGELDFSASRESLSYIPQTLTAIKSKLQKFHDFLTKQVDDILSPIDNIWQKSNALDELNRKYYYRLAISNWAASTGNTWATGYGLSFWVTRSQLDSSGIAVLGKYSPAKYSSGRLKYSRKLVKGNLIFTQHSANDDAFSVNTSGKVAFVIDDVAKGVVTRATEWNSKNPEYSVIYIITSKDRVKSNHGFDSKHLTEFTEIFQAPLTVIKASSIPVPARTQPSVRTVIKNSWSGIKICKVTIGDYYYRGSDALVSWVQPDDSLDLYTGTRYYVELSGSKPVNSSLGRELGLMQRSALKGFPVEVFGVQKNAMDKIKRLPNWIPLESAVNQKLSAIPPDVLEAYAVAYHLEHHAGVYARLMKNLDTKISSKSELRKTLGAISDMSLSSVKYTVEYLRSHRDGFSTLLKTAETRIDNLYKTYPLLETVCQKDADLVAHYVNLVDASAKSA